MKSSEAYRWHFAENQKVREQVKSRAFFPGIICIAIVGLGALNISASVLPLDTAKAGIDGDASITATSLKGLMRPPPAGDTP